MTRFDQHQGEEIIIENIKDFSDEEQAEMIADKFAAVSQEYDKLEDGDIELPKFNLSDVPIVTEKEVAETLSEMDSNKAM